LIVARYEVLGNGVKRYVRPVGTIERPALGLHTAARAQATIDRPLRGRDVAIVARYGVPGKREEGGAVPAGTIEKKRIKLLIKHIIIRLYYMTFHEKKMFHGAHILFA
jgi:hypothetical protein